MITQGFADSERLRSIIRNVMVFVVSVITHLAFASASHHNQVDIVSSDQSSEVSQWQSWPKVGQARLSILFFDVYDSALYSPVNPVANWPKITQQPTALTITYLRDISAQDFVDATKEQWQKMGFSQAQITPWIAKLEDIFPDVIEGDSLTYVSQNRRGEFWFTSHASTNLIGEVEDSVLNAAFLAIWLSPSTSYPKLRAQLLGETQ